MILNLFKLLNKSTEILFTYLNNPKRANKKILKYKIQKTKGKYSSMPKFINFTFIFNELSKQNTSGSLVEIGTAGGMSLAQITLLRNLYFKDKNIFSFDTFENTHSDSPMLKVSQLDDLCIPNLKNAGIKNPKKEIEFIVGDVNDTLVGFNQDICFLHIDVDIPSVYKVVLENLWDNLVPNSFIIFDEYDDENDIKKFGNMKKVIDTFLSDKNYEKIEIESLSKFCIKKF